MASSAFRTSQIIPLTTLAIALTTGCRSKPKEPDTKTETEAASKAPLATGTALNAPGQEPKSKTKTGPRRISPDDPLKGKFSLEDATQGLTGEGKLTAKIETSLGELSCELYAEKAPITVANFVGLARGLRPFKKDGAWVKEPGYDGTSFHRVIKGFMIQGGDPEGTGAGEPGYVIPDEMWEGAKHDERGLLCMANRGPNTNGMQFFITDAAAPHLDRSYTIFGRCGPDTTIEKLASVDTPQSTRKPGGRADRPFDPPKIKKVTVERK